jgi:hypothetical protein
MFVVPRGHAHRVSMRASVFARILASYSKKCSPLRAPGRLTLDLAKLIKGNASLATILAGIDNYR